MKEKELLQMALNEINGLRKQNHEMGIQLGIFEKIYRICSGEPIHQTGAIHPDIAQKIQQFLTVKEK